MKEDVYKIINFYDEDVERPVESIVTFRDMIKDLLRFIKNYKPVENQEYAMNEVNYAFTEYIFNLEKEGNLTEEQRQEILEFFRANLTKHFFFDPLKAPLADRLFNRARTFLNNPLLFTNPFETMSPEYVFKFHVDCILFEQYIRSEEYLQILNDRLIPYYNRDSAEGLSGGHNNSRKIEAIWNLIKDIGSEPSEEFTMLVKLVKEMKEKELRERR